MVYVYGTPYDNNTYMYVYGISMQRISGAVREGELVNLPDSGATTPAEPGTSSTELVADDAP